MAISLLTPLYVLAAPADGAKPKAAWHGLSAEELAEVFTPESLVRGVRADRDECAAKKFAVWVEHQYGNECIRYFPSRDVQGAARAAFFFHGDVEDGGRALASASVNNTVAGKLKEAQALATINGVPFIVVGRPGAFGSSGDHSLRRQPKEFYSINAAIDAIKAKHGIKEIIITGQSGGATTVGALLTLGRTDVVCAIETSGGLDTVGRAFLKGARPGCDTRHCNPYNVTNFVGGVKPDPRRRIFIVGDPADSNSYFKFQKAFADKLAAAGHDVTLVEAHATDPEHHSLTPFGPRAAGWCNAGLPTAEIVKKIQAGELALYNPKRAQRASTTPRTSDR